MTTPEQALRRILLVADATIHELPSLAAVVQLATRTRAELVGLFVEDDLLLRAASLPGARRISLLTGADERVDLASTERELRWMADALRSQLAAAADRARVKWSFRVVRGRLGAEVARAAHQVDFLVVDRSTRPRLGHLPLGGALRAAAEECRSSVLVLPAGARLDGPILVPYDGSEAADLTLRAAARLAGDGGGRLELLVAAHSQQHRDALEQRAREQLGEPSALAASHVLGTSPAAALQVLMAAQNALLVLGEPGRSAAADALRLAAEQLDLPVLTVRCATQ